MVGRFIGSALLMRIAAHRLLASVAIGAALFCVIVNQSHGDIAGAVALSIGLLNATMFPTIWLHMAYLVPMVAYACIAIFALGAGRVRLTRAIL